MIRVTRLWTFAFALFFASCTGNTDPNEGRVYFVRRSAGVTGATNIWSISGSGRLDSLRQHTTGEWNDLAPAVSPDGSLLAFTRAALDRAELRRVVVMHLASGRARTVESAADGQWTDGEPFWDPGSSTLGFSRSRYAPGSSPPGTARLWTAGIHRLSDGDVHVGQQQQLSPDAGLSRLFGHWNPATGADILFVNEYATHDGFNPYGIWRIRYPFGGEIEVVPPGCCGVYGPVYSPDGRRIAYAMHTTPVTAHVMVADADGRRATKITCSARWGNPSWSPDGANLVVDSPNGAPGLYRLRVPMADGGCVEPAPVFPHPVAAWDGHWSR